MYVSAEYPTACGCPSTLEVILIPAKQTVLINDAQRFPNRNQAICFYIACALDDEVLLICRSNATRDSSFIILRYEK